jgi:hypothetical protein
MLPRQGTLAVKAQDEATPVHSAKTETDQRLAAMPGDLRCLACFVLFLT